VVAVRKGRWNEGTIVVSQPCMDPVVHQQIPTDPPLSNRRLKHVMQQ